jgi:hypothetical protein
MQKLNFVTTQQILRSGRIILATSLELKIDLRFYFSNLNLILYWGVAKGTGADIIAFTGNLI